MTNKLRQITAAIATIGLISCGGGETTEPDTTVASVTVSGASTVAPAGQVQMTAIPKNAGGTALTGLTASWTSSQTSVATVNATTGLVTGVAVGTTTITATIATVPGTRQVTVQQVTVVGAATVTADNTNSFQPPQVDLSAGGTVTWSFNTVNAHNVTFQGSAAGTPGNITNQTSGTQQRTFSTAGTYSYSCTNHPGMSGVVIVH